MHDKQTDPAKGVWHGPEELPGHGTQLAAGQNEDGRLEVCWVTPDGVVHHDWQVEPSESWHGPEDLELRGKKVTVGHNHDGRLELFVLGEDGTIRIVFQTSPNGE